MIQRLRSHEAKPGPSMLPVNQLIDLTTDGYAKVRFRKSSALGLTKYYISLVIPVMNPVSPNIPTSRTASLRLMMVLRLGR
jgi:hypothetical protein